MAATFRILGPLEVLDGDRAVALGGLRQRALLALLLLRANEVVSTDRLIAELWGESPPPTARQTVQVYISQLRRAVPVDGVRRERDRDPLARLRPARRARGARPRPLPGAVGLRTRGAGRGRRRRRGGDARARPSGLWRGPPLADFAYEEWAQREIARLEEWRLACLEERIEADLRLGRRAELVGELEALVEEHPLRERLRGQLMLALYGSGRQAEALERYAAGRRALADELGIEPGRSPQGPRAAHPPPGPRARAARADGRPSRA